MGKWGERKKCIHACMLPIKSIQCCSCAYRADYFVLDNQLGVYSVGELILSQRSLIAFSSLSRDWDVRFPHFWGHIKLTLSLFRFHGCGFPVLYRRQSLTRCPGPLALVVCSPLLVMF